AVRSRLACRLTARFCATWFQVFQMGAEPQNFPAAVWSAVRVVLESWPRLLTSLSASAYATLVTGGGGPGRNCWPLRSTNGVTEPQLVNTGAGKWGGVGRQSRGWVPAMNGGAMVADPSGDRRAVSR